MFTLKCENPSSTCTLLYPDFQPVWTFWQSSSRGTPSYKPYRPDVPPQRVGFRASLVIKRGVDFAHFGLESGLVYKGTTGAYESIFDFNSK